MQFKSFMEALKGKQHKIDKNKNGEIDAHDFKLLRKEEEELEESEDRVARADYKVGPSGRKSHKEIVFKDAESKEDEDEDKKEMKEAKMSDADMAERERIVKGMKKNLTGFKARYGDRAKEVMYATATKQAMKEETKLTEDNLSAMAKKHGMEYKKTTYGANMSHPTHGEVSINRYGEWKHKGVSGDSSNQFSSLNKHLSSLKEKTVDEAVQKVDIPAYLRKQQGQTPLKLSDLKRKDTISDKENLAKLRNEESAQLDELSKDTLNSYMKKADADEKKKDKQGSKIENQGFKHPAGSSERQAKFDQGAALMKKAVDRHKGMVRALNKGANPLYKNGRRIKEEVEELDEKSDQAKRNKIMKNMMDASRGARYKLNNPVPDAEPEHKTTRAQNVAIGRALRSEEKKDDVPFDGPYIKTKPAKNSDGTTQSPMSRARALAKDAMKKQMKEDIDRLFEKDATEYDYEGEMAVTQLKTIIRHAEALQAKMQPDTNLPEWVQSKITLATDYIQTASDYLHSELEEQAPVAPVPDRKYIKGTPEHKAYKATKKPINGMPTNNMKETFDADGNIINHKVSYKDFAMMLEYETKDGRYVHKGTYGGTYVDPEGADDADDKKPKQQPADKRGRGRPAGAKSGARKITGTSKLFK
jgi:hypothetical protein